MTYLKSPLRYPGGKSWFTNFMNQWFIDNNITEICEPFVGGGSITLSAIDKCIIKKALWIEKDTSIYTFWKHCLYDGKKMMERINDIQNNQYKILNIINNKNVKDIDLAMYVLVKNRVSYGGIIEKAGIFKKGDGKGILSRWNYKNLINRINSISKISHMITLCNDDSLPFIEKQKIFPLFIDPPYVKAGKSMYKEWNIKHENLFSILSEYPQKFIMTYDNNDLIKDFGRKYNIKYIKYLRNKSNVNNAYELIFSNTFF